MNRHQVLTGACNAGDQCYAVGSVEGIHFTAYAAGCDIVILASDFQRVQIIPGVTHGNVKVSCVDCSTDTGKIAASYQNKVYIFEPTPLLHHESTHENEKLDYRWYQTASFEADCYINCVSWNMEGSKILTGGEVLQIWSYIQESHDHEGGGTLGKSVRFHVGGAEDNGDTAQGNHNLHDNIDKVETTWECVWRCRPATPVYHLKYSPDGLLFASAGKTDRLVKIWYEDRKLHLPLTKADSIVSPKKEELHFSFVYIAHPRAVTGFSWRKTSKYMPRGSVANMLVTSCIDNVCRLWCETILPDDGLVDLEQFDPNASMDPKFHTHRHKKRFMQRLKTIRSAVKHAVNEYRIQRQWSPSANNDKYTVLTQENVQRHAIHKRKRHHKFGPETVMSMPNFSSVQSVHDFHKFALHHSGVAPALHFHLAASINPETDIPLLPVVGAKGDQKFNFQLHWLNNKELEFTMEAEIILQDLHRGTLSGSENTHEAHHEENHEGSDSDHGGQEVAHEENEVDGHHKKKKSKLFKKRHKHHHSKHTKDLLGHHKDSSNSIASDHSDHTSEGTGGSSNVSPEVAGSVIDALDRKIEVLLRDWHQNADMMFSIHPVDGSYLVWLVDWLDEYNPYCFRQAQVSFSSRLPHAFPVPDARTMASNLLMYCNYSKMDIKSAMRMSENRTNEAVKIQNQPAPATGKSSPGQNDNMLIPNVLLITKHLNGSLNQWQVTFADQSKFSTVVSVAHASRACGHRFRTNSATCHPKLPLLLTTSHHNIPRESSKNSPVNNGDRNFNDENMDQDGLDAGCMDDQDHENLVGGVEFCSELILWRVDPVGPLSKSGGIVELARINSPHLSAFANVAWVPTLLPSSTLGSYSNSPSALFVASDGSCLRMYQAVIDARTVLLEMGSQRKEQGTSFCSTTSSGYSVETQKPASELFNIVSLQSSSRPGCIIELEAIADAKQNWQQTQLLHVFQEQLITGKPGSGPEGMEAIVDLRNISSFSEHFYLVVLEKAKDHGSTLHMWKITISSQPGSHIDGPADTNKTYAPDVYVVEDDGSNPPSRTGTPDHFHHKPTAVVKLSFSTTKVCTQKLSLPEGVDVQCATVSAGHLSSASIYPACLAPYLLVTACSDGDVRFWRCDMASVEGIDQSGLHCDVSLFTTSFEMAVEEEDGIRRQSTVVFTKSETVNTNYSWEEWKMCNQSSNSSAINIPGHPITVSCAYSGRVAVAYRLFGIRAAPDNPTGKLVNLWVAIYECESTGGSEWLLEDTIELKNVSIPDPKAEIDLNCIFSPGGASPNHLNDDLNSPKGISPSSSLVNVNMINRTKSVPSLSTICSVRKCISEFGNKAGVLQQKHLVELDWVSTEDGSHILTVGVGSKVLMYAQVSNDIVSASKHSDSDEQDNRHSFSKTLSKGALNLHLGGERSQTATKNKAMLQHRSKSMVLDDTPEQIQWMKLRSVELTTADGLPPLPMHISWVRAGILVVGMDNEMHVYSQWRNSLTTYDHCDADDRNFDDTSLSFVSALPTIKSTSAMKPSYSMPSFKHLNSLIKKTQDGNSNLNKSKSESMSSLSAIHEYGLFEAAHEANPVLPQYHPKKLMELLNFGKIRRVKAILVHLVRCISGGDVHPVAYSEEVENDESKWGFRPRTVSVSGASPNEIPLLHEEPQPDYKELTSIPLLPIYALLAADEDTTVAKIDPISTHSQANHTANQDYSDLFSTNVGQDEELNIDVLGTSADSNRSGPRQRLPSSSAQGKNPNYFGPGHSQVLTNHLTHTRLPGLSSLDQMYLLAIADTVANIKMDFAERFEAEKSEMNGTDSSSSGNHVTETIDDCGLRFLLAIRHHIYLLRTLPPRQRAVLKKQGLKSFNLVWAFHSEATEELLSYLPNMHKGEPTWEELRQFGAGWWIRSISLLKRTVEKLAKIAFQANKDPLDAAIFYLAMRKKNVLWGLYRSIDNRRMMDFFKHDFTEERWRKAALKNAFDLLGKQRFLHAAAFFLLAGALNDAVEVCLDKLNDIQLALVICRLYDGEDIMSDSAKRILQTVILGHSDSGNNTSRSKPHPDPFLRSMALWLFKDYKMSLKTLLNSGYSGIQGPDDTDGVDSNNTTPSVFNFYNYLRTHPLLVRQRIIKAAPIVANRRKVIPGFTKQNTIVEANENTVFIDKVTPMERRLFFKTAHTHYKNGCPLLALEVLSKLPSMICEEDTDEEDSSVNPGLKPSEGCISTGQLGDFENNSSGSKCGDNSSSNGLDWGQPMTNGFGNSGSGVDSQMADAFDWGAPNTKLEDEEPNFKISDGESEESESDEKKVHFDVNGGDKKGKLEKVPPIVVDDGDISDNVNGVTKGTHTKKTDNKVQVDIFAQQYMFISCLKVLMEEMRTLATGFEVDGGQLRFQLYIWLEREVEVLRYLCHYSEDEMSREDVDQPLTSEGDLDTDPEDSSSHLEVTPPRVRRSHSVRSDVSVGTYKPTLHEVILAEKMDFEAKMERMSKRKQWLKTHSQLLRTLASYCVLQGSGGGGLASVQMELLLLLQEHQQEKPQQQLLSPLPFPTTLPLLSASIASSKTVVADPIQHISCMAQDLLHSIIEVTSPPDVTSSINTVLVMRNLSLALSACVYQCLCDCDSFVVSLNEGSDVMLEGFTSHNFTNAQAGHLMAGVQRYRRKSSAGEDIINTPPSKWPGVTSLRVLLAREKDEDAPKLHILLCETLVAVYVSLLVNAMSMYDCHMLYRLVSHKFEQQMWSALFGGGVKTVLKVANSSLPHRGDDLSKQRMKLNMRVMGSGGAKEKKTYKETFVPPELSMITFFMTKPFTSLDGGFSYDSEESLSSEEEEDEDSDFETTRPNTLPLSAVQQHVDPTSYAWCLIRFTVIKMVLHNLRTFLPQVGIELPELPVCSPLMHAVLKTLEQWMEVLQGKLDLFSGPPDEFISGLQFDVVTGIPISKYHALLNPSNTPFIDSHSTLPIKRLWFHLIKQEPLKEIFIRYIFRRQRQQTDSSRESSTNLDSTDGAMKFKDPMKVIHKEQDIITAFALNQTTYLEANTNCLSLSTQKEIVELDIGPLLNPPTWLEDENEMDIEYIKNPTPASAMDSSDFFVVQTPMDSMQSAVSSSASSPMTGMSTPNHSSYQTGRSTSVILRRPVAGVRRIGSHPTLPHYLTGSADGSVRLYEWGHIQPLAMLRQPGAFPKVTKVLFSSQGNKCCVSDTEGDICLWQVGMGSNFNKPIMSLKCHNKTTSDFTFVGSSSLIATAGHSSESKNVCLWDMLLPPRSACIHAFTCHEHGCPALAYAPHHQLLITGGRKGEVCIFDIRQRQLRHTFQAHDVPIRCLAMDPEEEYFVTGSSEGDIKVWGLDIHQLVVNFPGEHNKTTFFQKMGSASGVTQVGIGPNHHLFSCGVDGSIKFRALPERESMVRYWTSDLK